MKLLDARNNLLTVILLGAIAAVALLGLAGALVVGRVAVDRIEPASLPPVDLGQALASPPELPEFSSFAAIIDRPLFFEDRALPEIVAGDDGEDQDAAAEPEPVRELPPLDSVVAGIIITPEVKLAMITDKKSRQTEVLREGMALSGPKSAWRVVSIEPRSVRLETDQGESELLELEVATRPLAAGAAPVRRQAAAQPQTATPTETEPAQAQNDAEAAARARAEEIRRKVAERRAQLRAEAERRAREGGQ